jgi:DNA polymerase III gamma/tau subunit
MANGSMRDGLSLLDRLISTGVEPLTASLLEEFLGCPNSEKIYNLIAKIGDSDAAGTLTATEDLINAGLGEVQLVDSLIDYMRDLMVIKSAGTESELLVLTAEQRQQAGRLAEKFDVAALVYNITTLERLRQTLKYSDTPRALLDASLLRFALSEHFLNIDELLSQLKACPTHQGVGPAVVPIKKKQIANPNTTTTVTGKPTEPASKQQTSSTENQTSGAEKQSKTTGQRRNELINDPAVRTVLMGLDATITGINEDQQDGGSP